MSNVASSNESNGENTSQTGRGEVSRRNFIKAATASSALLFPIPLSVQPAAASEIHVREGFFPIGVSPGEGTPTEFLDIPFVPVPDGTGHRNMVTGRYEPISVGRQLDAVYFLGMTTERPEGSEGWGRWERYHDHSHRLFIGDRVGSILVFYEDPDVTLDTFPVIFGVNVWPYEMFTPRKPEEKSLEAFHGPYREPFDSDPEAARLLHASLLLHETDGAKACRYVFGIQPRPKPIQSIWIRYEDFRRAHYVVSAVTGFVAAPEIKSAAPVRTYSQPYFLRQEYYSAMDRLARRLYQFRDELPSRVAPKEPKGYTGPCARFAGSTYAAIAGNVYAYNVYDMAQAKLDPDGTPHTSTAGSPSFGHTRGFGTFRNDVGTYHSTPCARDTGRSLTEIAHSGYANAAGRVVDRLLHFLYDANAQYGRPSWKRVMNESARGGSSRGICKENDGHGAIMLALAAITQKGYIPEAYVDEKWSAFRDAADWFVWQMQHPEESGFDGVLCSRSEATYQGFGGFDLFSNTYAAYGLRAFARLARAMHRDEDAARWEQHAAVLWDGVLRLFVSEHPRHGRVFMDLNEDCWTYEYKRFAPLFALADYETLDPADDAPEIRELAAATYAAQKEDYFAPASGREMGYGQGYLGQTAILLDALEDARAIVEEAAAFCYHHTDHNYLVPEGVIAHPSGRFWIRNGDLGNAVHQAEIVKVLRLLIGIDDLQPARGLRLIPRLPQGWTSLEVERYPVALGNGETAQASLRYTRLENGYRLEVAADVPLKIASLRVGPFPKDDTTLRSDESMTVSSRVIGEQRFAYLVPHASAKRRLSVTVRAT